MLEDILDSCSDPVDQVYAASVQQPPAQAQVSPVRLEVIAVRVLEVVVVVVLQADLGALAGGLRGSERDDRSEVVAAAQQVQLDAGEEGEEGEGVQKREGSCYRCLRQWGGLREGGLHAANLHLVPQLGLAFLALLLAAGCWAGFSWAGAAVCCGLALDRLHDLAGVHEAVRLQAGAAAIVLGCVCHARRRGAGQLAGADTAGQTLRLLLLQLFQHLLHRQGIEDVLRRRRQDSEHSEGAVLLVLFEAPA